MNLSNEYLEKVLTLWEKGKDIFPEWVDENDFKLINYSKAGENEGLYTFEQRIEDRDYDCVWGEFSFYRVIQVNEEGKEPIKINQYAFSLFNRYVCGLFLYGKELYAVVTTGYCVYNERKVVRKVWPDKETKSILYSRSSRSADDIPIFDKILYRIDAESGILVMEEGHSYYKWNQEAKEWVNELEIPCSNGFISDLFADKKPFYNCSKETAELIMEKGYDAGDIPGYSDLPHTESWVKD